MELKQLEHLLAIIDCGSLSGAADRVGLTQQAISRSLARLEESLGGQLFERNARGVTLTRLGETVAEHARDVIASAGRLEIAAAAELGLERGKLVIGLSPIAAMTKIGYRVTEFAESHPKLRIDIESGIEQDFAAKIHRGQVDIAIAGQMKALDEGIMVEQISSERWGIAGRTDHSLLASANKLGDLNQARWLIGRNTEQLDETITASFESAGATPPRPGIMTTSVLYALRGVASSNYLSILPQSLCAGLPWIQWKDFVEGDWCTPINLMRRRRAHLSLGVLEICQWLQK